MPEPIFSADELATCAEREAKQRERLYTQLGLTMSRRREIAMMRAIARHFREASDAIGTDDADLSRQSEGEQS